MASSRHWAERLAASFAYVSALSLPSTLEWEGTVYIVAVSVLAVSPVEGVVAFGPTSRRRDFLSLLFFRLFRLSFAIICCHRPRPGCSCYKDMSCNRERLATTEWVRVVAVDLVTDGAYIYVGRAATER